MSQNQPPTNWNSQNSSQPHGQQPLQPPPGFPGTPQYNPQQYQQPPQGYTQQRQQPQPNYPQQYQQQEIARQPQAPLAPAAGPLKTDRAFWKYLVFTPLTLGIYALIYLMEIGDTTNIIASRYDGKRTMNYILVALILAPLTLGIMAFVWFHGLSNRIGNELRRRGHSSTFSASTFWLWGVLGALIVVGPFIYVYKLTEAMNELSADYNRVGY